MMPTPPFLTSSLIPSHIAKHGFFGRAGGTSNGVFESLNVGMSSTDAPHAVTENRLRCAHALGNSAIQLLTLRQIHSAKVVVIETGLEHVDVEADAMVTKTPNIALGVLAADCMPWLFIDPQSGVIGAAHAGWRGALAGVLEATIAAMINLGATPSTICAAVGPALRQRNFEVGQDLIEQFKEKYPQADMFFEVGTTKEKKQFDLTGFGAWQLRQLGVHTIDDLDICTLDDPEKYFSYRDSRAKKQLDFGRNLSAIALA